VVHVRMMLDTLRHHKHYGKASKCQFGRPSVGFLGHVKAFVSQTGVGMARARSLSAVAEWAPGPTGPLCVVHCFIGLANHNRRFLPVRAGFQLGSAAH
jgi:hypothetical protein